MLRKEFCRAMYEYHLWIGQTIEKWLTKQVTSHREKRTNWINKWAELNGVYINN